MATADFELLSELRVVSDRIALAAVPTEKLSGRRELEDRIAFSLFLVSRIDRVRDFLLRETEGQPSGFDWNRARDVSGLYSRWLDGVEPLVSKLPSLENDYGKLDGADELRARYRDVKLMSLDVDHLKQAIESFREGRGISFDVAMEDLRSKLQ